MGVYIKDMEMPPVGRILLILPSGRVLEVSADKTQNIYSEAETIPVPPHGRLGDLDALEKRARPVKNFENPESLVVALGAIRCAPTIIPAEEGEE